MDALDRAGLYRVAETRHFTSSASGIRQLEMLIRRDRNRPSVFFWSLGNEEPRHRTDEGVRMFRRMRAAVERLDRTKADYQRGQRAARSGAHHGGTWM